MPTMTNRKNGRSASASVSVNDVMKEFCEAYADAVTEWEWTEEWQTLSARRQLQWKAARRIPLAHASWIYQLMSHGYNLYRPHMIPILWGTFYADKIEVTAVREYSVGIHLHIPDAPGLRQRVETFCNEHFEADIVTWLDDETLRIWWD